MFCPKCGAEYIEGIVECADCRVPLKLEPPRHVDRKPKEFTEILRTFNQGDIALIKSILDNERIEYIFYGEYFNQVGPLIQPATLIVRKDQAERVRELLKGMNVTFLGVSYR